MTETVPSSAAVKRRQYLLLAGVGAVIVAGTLFSVSLTGSRPAIPSRQPQAEVDQHPLARRPGRSA
jgi:hypothetical protein